MVGVGSSPPATSFSMGVSRDDDLGFNTGIALANSSDETVRVRASLVGNDGTNNTRTIVLMGHSRIAQYLTQIFASVSDPFYGSLHFDVESGDDGIHPLVLLDRRGLYSSLPVIGPSPTDDPCTVPPGQKDLEISIRYRVTERNNVYWQFSWILEIANNTATESEYRARINFLDAEGFVVDYDIDYGLTVPARSTGIFRGVELIYTENAPGVKSVEAVVTRQ